MTSETLQPTTPDDLPKTQLDGGGRRFVVPVLLALLGVSVYLNVFATPAGPPSGWGEDFNAAMAKARETKKPVVVVFYADG